MVCLLLLSVTTHAYEPYTGWDALDVALRGGGTALVGGQNLTASVGAAAGLEVDYRLIVPVASQVGLGPKVGLGASYRQTRLRCAQSDWRYEEVSPKGVKMVDILDLTGSEINNQWYMELPVMLALNAKQFVLNVGVIPMLGLTQRHQTQLDNHEVTTFIEVADVKMNHTLTLREDGQRVQPQFGLLVGGEVGYEFEIAREHRLGVQVYCRYNVLQEQPWSQDAFCYWQQNQLMGGSLTEAFSDKLHYLDFGLRVYYTFAQPHSFRRLGLRF